MTKSERRREKRGGGGNKGSRRCGDLRKLFLTVWGKRGECTCECECEFECECMC